MSERELAIREVIVALRSPIAIASRRAREEALALARRYGFTAEDLILYLDAKRRGGAEGC